MTVSVKMNCRELVELITEYLESKVPAPDQRRLEEHLLHCGGCRTYVDQIRSVVHTMGRLSQEPVPSETKDRLLELFRTQALPEGKRQSVRLGLNSETASLGDHIAYFWETDRDFRAGVGFLEVGLRGKDHCFVFGHEQANQKILDILWEKGLDIPGLTETGRLCVLGGEQSSEVMLASIGARFQAALEAGAPLIRLLANLGWRRDGWPEDDGILEFEAKVTGAARQFPCVIVCMYDVRALPGRIILKGGFETHPLTVHGDVLRENPCYVPVDLFLHRLREESGSDRIQ